MVDIVMELLHAVGFFLFVFCLFLKGILKLILKCSVQECGGWWSSCGCMFYDIALEVSTWFLP